MNPILEGKFLTYRRKKSLIICLYNLRLFPCSAAGSFGSCYPSFSLWRKAFFDYKQISIDPFSIFLRVEGFELPKMQFFYELNTEHKRPEGLEPTTGFQILPVFYAPHKMFTNSPFRNRSIPSPKGSEPPKLKFVSDT